jgi:hypothetical protein
MGVNCGAHPFIVALDPGSLKLQAQVTPMNDNALCPRCGDNLLRSSDYPHGRDSDGAIRKARMCPNDDLYFGQAFDGSWSVPVEPVNINQTLVGRSRS